MKQVIATSNVLSHASTLRRQLKVCMPSIASQEQFIVETVETGQFLSHLAAGGSALRLDAAQSVEFHL